MDLTKLGPPSAGIEDVLVDYPERMRGCRIDSHEGIVSPALQSEVRVKVPGQAGSAGDESGADCTGDHRISRLLAHIPHLRVSANWRVSCRPSHNDFSRRVGSDRGIEIERRSRREEQTGFMDRRGKRAEATDYVVADRRKT